MPDAYQRLLLDALMGDQEHEEGEGKPTKRKRRGGL